MADLEKKELEETPVEEEVRPDKDLKIDESQLSDEDLAEYKNKNVPIGLIITMGVIVTLMIACIIVIVSLS